MHRGVNDGAHSVGRTCYVNVAFAPTAVWSAYKRGSYTPGDEAALRDGLKGRKLRLGAYGDPLALPLGVLEELVGYADGHVGYTHQWASPSADAYRHLVMASWRERVPGRACRILRLAHVPRAWPAGRGGQGRDRMPGVDGEGQGAHVRNVHGL